MQMVSELLTFLCEQRLGSSYDKVLQKARQDEARRVVQARIPLGPTEDMRADVTRFFAQHVQLHGSPSTQLAIADLFQQLDPEVVKFMPGRSEAVALLEAPGLSVLAAYQAGAKAIAIKAQDIAEKLFVGKAAKKPTGPTLLQEDKQTKQNESNSSGGSKEGNSK